eukprot:363202-Chlamydomonas_euryale.AAC.1
MRSSTAAAALNAAAPSPMSLSGVGAHVEPIQTAARRDGNCDGGMSGSHGGDGGISGSQGGHDLHDEALHGSSPTSARPFASSPFRRNRWEGGIGKRGRRKGMG